MKIAIIGANGKVGQKIVQAALAKHWDVWAIVRGSNHSEAPHYILKDLFELNSDDLKDFDVIVSAIGVWEETTLNQHLTSLEHLSKILSNKDNRLIVVGGAGSLYMNEDHALTLSETKDFPDAFKPLAKHMQVGLDYLRTQDKLKWTYLSPAADFQAKGIQSGKYQIGGEVFMINEQGESVISYADYANALIEEAEQGSAIRRRISVIAV